MTTIPVVLALLKLDLDFTFQDLWFHYSYCAKIYITVIPDEEFEGF